MNLNVKEIGVSSISTAEDINDTIHVIVDCRFGICPLNDTKWNVADTLLPHVAAEVSFQSAQRTEWSLCWTQIFWLRSSESLQTPVDNLRYDTRMLC